MSVIHFHSSTANKINQINQEDQINQKNQSSQGNPINGENQISLQGTNSAKSIRRMNPS